MSGGAAPDTGQAAERAADFARRFAEYWRGPTPDRLDSILSERVRLVAPMMPATEGLEAGRRVFARLLGLIPDLRAEVDRWGPTADGVLIEFTMRGSAGGAPISWRAVDRFVLDDDGLAAERVSYFDSMPVAMTYARRPRAWPGMLRARLLARR